MVSYVVCATMGEDYVTLGRMAHSRPFAPVPTSFAHPHQTLEEAERPAKVCPLSTLIIEFDLATERCCDPALFRSRDARTPPRFAPRSRAIEER